MVCSYVFILTHLVAVFPFFSQHFPSHPSCTVMVANMRKRFPQSCTYRMTAYKILKGSHLFNNTVNGKLRVNIQFPRENCTKRTDGCIRLEKGVRYLIGAHVRAQQHKRKSLQALLPSAFVTADVSPGMIRNVARHLSCALFNEHMMTTLPSPTTTASSTPPPD